jgi:hypothetical protein
MGFADRADSFDLNVALQDHFKWIKKEAGFTREAAEPQAPKLDLAFKAGQTIKINIPLTEGQEVKSRPKGAGAATGGFLPPPPGGVKLPPSSGDGGFGAMSDIPSAANLTPLASPSSNTSVSDLLGGLGSPVKSSQQQPLVAAPLQPAAQNNSGGGDDMWGDFATAASGGDEVKSSGNWEQF